MIICSMRMLLAFGSKWDKMKHHEPEAKMQAAWFERGVQYVRRWTFVSFPNCFRID